jgi:hypothetical protein
MPGVFRAIAGWLGDGSPLAVLAWLLEHRDPHAFLGKAIDDDNRA